MADLVVLITQFFLATNVYKNLNNTNYSNEMITNNVDRLRKPEAISISFETASDQ